MAQIHYRWRKVLVFVCTPCIILAVIFFYTFIMLCMGMHGTVSVPVTGMPEHRVASPHFVAQGTLRNTTFAGFPKTFWEQQSKKNGFWNQIQMALDRHFNPILHPRSFKTDRENSTFHESILRKTLSDVADLDNKQKDFDTSQRLLQNFVRSMERRDYPPVFQPKGACGAGAKDENEPPLLLLAIKSTAQNFKNRLAIRQTWGREGWIAGQKSNSTEGKGGGKGGGYVRRVFLFGRNTEKLDLDLTELLQLESGHYGDILQWDFEDTFFNLTLKDVLFWRWFSRFCSHTHFVFKGDDDVLVNTPGMITHLQNELRKPQAHTTMKEFMIGDVIGAAVPDRTKKSKYFIPDSFYQGLYPTYAGGGGVVYSGQLTLRLHNVSKRVHLFPIDDVYVGMCMTRLNAQPVHHPAFLTFDFPGTEEKEPCSYHKILVVHKRSPSQLVKLWDNMKRTQTQCWDVPLRDGVKKTSPVL